MYKRTIEEKIEELKKKEKQLKEYKKDRDLL